MPETLWIASCVHIGAEEHASTQFKNYLEYAARKNWDMVFIGDLLNMGLCYGTKHIGSIWQDHINPQKQLDKAIELLKPYKKQILGMSTGNHENRAFNVTGLLPIKIIADHLGVPYLGSQAIMNWNKKRIFVAHGASSGKFTDFDKVLKMHDNLDAIVLGHTHELNHFVSRKFTASGDTKLVHCIRTGSFLDNAEYARAALYPPTPIGSALIELYNGNINVRCGLVGI